MLLRQLNRSESAIVGGGGKQMQMLLVGQTDSHHNRSRTTCAMPFIYKQPRVWVFIFFIKQWLFSQPQFIYSRNRDGSFGRERGAKLRWLLRVIMEGEILNIQFLVKLRQ